MPLNLPSLECVNPSNCFMSLLIPSPTSTGKDFDIFLEPLIEELKELWKGVNTFHVLHRDNKKGFTLRATVLWCIHDFPALSTLLGRTTKGYYACIYYDKNPLSRSLRKKLGYLGHHRYLPMDTLGGRAWILMEKLRTEMCRKSSPYRRSLRNSRR